MYFSIVVRVEVKVIVCIECEYFILLEFERMNDETRCVRDDHFFEIDYLRTVAELICF